MAFDADMAFLVCTNTWRDYSITVKRGKLPAQLDRLVLDNLLPVFGRAVASESPPFGTAVGIAALPDASGDVFAFRVFDCGVYQGRGHTVGIVGIVIPWSGRRLALAELLSSLAPPKPDLEYYELPMVSGDPGSCSDEPYRSLNAWAEQGRALPTDQAVCFCHPAELVPQLVSWPVRKGPPAQQSNRGIVAWLTAILAIILAIGFIAWAGWKQLGAGHVAPIAMPADKPNLDGGRVRDLLVAVLPRLQFVNGEQAKFTSTSDLKRLATTAEAWVRDQIGAMCQDLIVTPPSASWEQRVAPIERWLDASHQPDMHPPTDGVVPTERDVERALGLLKDHEQLRGQAERILKLGEDESERKRFLAEAQRLLTPGSHGSL